MNDVSEKEGLIVNTLTNDGDECGMMNAGIELAINFHVKMSVNAEIESKINRTNDEKLQLLVKIHFESKRF